MLNEKNVLENEIAIHFIWLSKMFDQFQFRNLKILIEEKKN